jgi:hypothetical protein
VGVRIDASGQDIATLRIDACALAAGWRAGTDDARTVDDDIRPANAFRRHHQAAPDGETPAQSPL